MNAIRNLKRENPSAEPRNSSSTTTIAMSAQLLNFALANIQRHVDRCRDAAHMTADYAKESGEWQREYLRNSVIQDLDEVDDLLIALRAAAPQETAES